MLLEGGPTLAGGVPARRAGRRGRRLPRPDPARRRLARGRRPRHRDDRRRAAAATRRRDARSAPTSGSSSPDARAHARGGRPDVHRHRRGARRGRRDRPSSRRRASGSRVRGPTVTSRRRATATRSRSTACCLTVVDVRRRRVHRRRDARDASTAPRSARSRPARRVNLERAVTAHDAARWPPRAGPCRRRRHDRCAATSARALGRRHDLAARRTRPLRRREGIDHRRRRLADRQRLATATTDLQRQPDPDHAGAHDPRQQAGRATRSTSRSTCIAKYVERLLDRRAATAHPEDRAA